ncbi:MAG: helix-turn-helix domain-containing protein [Phycisphaerae bacterium]|nr:helix-turn-helix domain-containing protein [Phycisphaerae bacterium]
MSTTRNARPEPPSASLTSPPRPTPPPASALVTTRELAAVLGVTADTIRGWARSGRIPCLRVGQKTLRFDREAVLAAIRDGRASEGGAA